MKYSKEKTKEICDRLENGNNREDSANLSDISKETFYQWMKKPDFSDAVKKAELKCKERNISIIQKAAITTWQAAAWWLERKHREEFALKNILAHSIDMEAETAKAEIANSVNSYLGELLAKKH